MLSERGYRILAQQSENGSRLQSRFPHRFRNRRPSANTRRAIIDIDNVEIIITGGARGAAANAADHVALALMVAGATVDFPGRPNQAARPALPPVLFNGGAIE